MAKPPKKRKPASPRLPKTGTAESYTNVVLEEIRAQNRATIEAVHATRQALEQKIDDLRRDHSMRLDVLEGAVRQNSADIRQNSADIRQNSADIQKNSADIQKNSADIQTLQKEVARLSVAVDHLGTLEPRVEALEKKALPS